MHFFLLTLNAILTAMFILVSKEIYRGISRIRWPIRVRAIFAWL